MKSMPRFSDVFSWDTCQHGQEKYTFINCYLLKDVHQHKSLKKIDKIIFDVSGMFLFFIDQTNVYGPYSLTT